MAPSPSIKALIRAAASAAESDPDVREAAGIARRVIRLSARVARRVEPRLSTEGRIIAVTAALLLEGLDTGMGLAGIEDI